MKRVEVRIRGDRTRVETSGFTGEACTDATRGLQLRLGGEIVSTEHTPEMYREPLLTETEELG